MEKELIVVNVRVDSRVVKILRRMAITQETSVQSLVSEALATWLKWMRKAEMKEQALENAEKKHKELEHAREILQQIVAERRLLTRQRKAQILPLKILRQRGPLPILTLKQIARMERKLHRIKKAVENQGNKA